MEEYLSSSRLRDSTPLSSTTKLTASSLFTPSATTHTGTTGTGANSPSVIDRYVSTTHHTSTIPHGNPSKSLREDFYEERSKLEKTNFDLKMKIYHLEEHLKKLQESSQRRMFSDDALKNELAELRLQLDEQAIELEQRNLLLVKSKAAIEAMKAEMERLRGEGERQNDLEERVRRLKQMNDEIESDYRQQTAMHQNEIQNLQQRLTLKEKEREIAEERAKQLEMSMAQANDRSSSLQNEKGRAEDKWIQAQQTIAAQEEELAQCRAHLDLFKIRVEEEREEKETLKEQVKTLSTEKLVNEEKQRSRLIELSGQHELQLATIRMTHEQDLERLRNAHAQAMEKERESHQNELAKAKQQMERNLLDIKASDSQDVQRIKEECAARVAEKQEEIKALRGIIEADRARYENLLQEMETTRGELRDRSVALEHLKRERETQSDEISALQGLRTDLADREKRLLDTQEALKRENSEKMQLLLRIEQMQNESEILRQTIKEQDAELHVHKSEMQRLTHVTSDLSSKTDGLESVIRDNEKLKILQHKLQTELLDAQHRIASREKDLSHAESEKERFSRELQRLYEERDANQRTAAELRTAVEEKTRQCQEEKALRLASEAALSEQRQTSLPVREELRALQEELSLSTQRERENANENAQKIRALWESLSLMHDTLSEWDLLLDAVLHGESERERINGHAALQTLSRPRESPFSLLSLSSRSQKRGPPSRERTRVSLTSSRSMREKEKEKEWERERDRDYEEVSLSLSDCDEARHAIALAAERVSFKVDRASKIRQIFAQTTSRLQEQMEKTFSQSQEKTQLLQLRLQEAHQTLQRLQQVFSRDQVMHAQELTELRTLREVLLKEHAQTIKEHGERERSLLTQLEQEKATHEQTQRRLARAQEESETRRKEVASLQSELNEFAASEALVAAIEQRMQTLSAKNQQLEEREKELRGLCEQKERERESVAREKTQAVSEIDRLSLQLDLKHEQLQDCELKLERYQKEMERLRARQIDPDLAMSLLNSAQYVSAVDGREREREQERRAPTQRDSEKESLIETLLSAEKAVKSLVLRSEEAITRFEFVVRNYHLPDHAQGSVSSRGRQIAQELQEDLRHLLQENVHLLSKVMQWISLCRANKSPSYSSTSTTLERERDRERQQQQQQFYPNHRRGAQTEKQREIAGGIVLEDLMDDWKSPVKSPAKETHNTIGQSLRTASVAAPVISSGLRTNSNWSAKDSYRPTREAMVSQSVSSLPPPTVLSSMDTDQLMDLLESRRTSSGKMRTAPTNNTAVDSSGPSLATSTTSGGRANKLDRSLQQLARKLDAFDLSTK